MHGRATQVLLEQLAGRGTEGSTSGPMCVHDILNLGCGRKRMEGATNLDRTAETQPDVVHDLNRMPWPFADNSFRAVHASDVIEHLDDVMQAME